MRVSRFAEALAVIKGLFGSAPFDFEGEHYSVHSLDGLPKPLQQPHPPLFVGGGSPRVLRLAGREADIVGINASLHAGELGAHAVRDLTVERVAEKIGWVREGARAAGRDPDSLALEMNHWLARVTPSASAADDLLARMGARFGVEPAILAASPSVLVGTVSQIIDTLQARRAELGISDLQLDAGFPTRDLDAFAPVIETLAGT